MRQAPIDELIKKSGSVYKLVVVASRRAKELAEGAPKLIDTDLKKVASIALEEIHQGKVICKMPEGEAGAEPKKGRAKAAKAESVKVGSKKKK